MKPSARANCAIAAVISVLALSLISPAGASGDAPCVQVRGACFATVQAAVTTAQDGDTVRIPAGWFAGGVTITTSITLAGAGADQTVLIGGDHVLTVGTFGATSEPTVHIQGVTLTGGIAHSSPISVPFTGLDSVFATGGGLEIPPSDAGMGATVTVVHSVIRGNRAAPTRTLLPSPSQQPFWPRCPDGFCRFAAAQGAGVDNWGNLTLRNTTVANNTADGPVSDSDGGGIHNGGTLTLERSAVTGNRAAAGSPNGRFAEGGGIFSDDSTTLTMRASTVSGNTASLSSTFPYFLPDGSTIDQLANSGGIHVGDHAHVTILSSAIDANTVSFDDPNGQWGVINAGLQVGQSPLMLRDTSISHNRLRAQVMTTADSGPLGGAIEWDFTATISRARIVGNTNIVTSRNGEAGVAAAVAALAILTQGSDPGPSTMSDSIIQGNTSTATTSTGPATVLGAGLLTQSSLTLHNVTISKNRGVSIGNGGLLRGGGIANGALLPGATNDPPSRLTLQGTRITFNALSGGPALHRQGGGIFTTAAITVSESVIARNRPDQCVGCSIPTATGWTRTSAGRGHQHRSGTEQPVLQRLPLLTRR